jgi:chromosome segregation ATPase
MQVMIEGLKNQLDKVTRERNSFRAFLDVKEKEIMHQVSTKYLDMLKIQKENLDELHKERSDKRRSISKNFSSIF